MRRYGLMGIVVASVFCLVQAAHAETRQDPDTKVDKVDVKKNGDAVVVDASFKVDATQQEAWSVIVDFDHMTKFLPNLQSSKILEQSAGKMRVEQKGRVGHGPLSVAFESVRDIELTPYKELRSHLVSGTLKKGEGVTSLSPDGQGTRVTFHNESVSSISLPAGLGAGFVESETRDQLVRLRNEILRRKQEKKQ